MFYIEGGSVYLTRKSQVELLVDTLRDATDMNDEEIFDSLIETSDMIPAELEILAEICGIS